MRNVWPPHREASTTRVPLPNRAERSPCRDGHRRPRIPSSGCSLADRVQDMAASIPGCDGVAGVAPDRGENGGPGGDRPAHRVREESDRNPGRKDVRPFRRPQAWRYAPPPAAAAGLTASATAEPLAGMGSMLWTAGEAGISGD